MKIKKSLQMPHQYVILAVITIIMALLTYIIPAGNFERKKVTIHGVDRSIVVPGTFQEAEENTPVTFLEMMTAPYTGMIQAAAIVFFTFMIYPSFYLILKTGALNGFIATLIRILGNKGWVVIPVFTILFGISTSTVLSGAEFYGFIPIFAVLTIALGYDALVGFAIVVLGSYTGFAAATTNPFNIVIAQSIADLPIYSGLSARLIIFAIHMAIIVVAIMLYAAKVKKNPSLSLVKDLDLKLFDLNKDNLDEYKIIKRHWFVFALVFTSISILIYGIFTHHWGMSHIVGIFFTMGIGSAIIMGWNLDKIATEFIIGMQNIVFGAMIAGVSRGILVVLEAGNITDTIMNSMSQVLSSLPHWLTAVGMLVTQTLINFFIPSGSGQAMTTMPIMIGLADILNISRQVAVTAFQFGDGLSNLLWPTAATAIVCGIIGLPLQRWWKFYIPIFITLFTAEAIIIIVLSLINFS